MKSLLLRVWRRLPFWLQGIFSRFIRPSFQVFASAVIINKDKQLFSAVESFEHELA
jgi:hypothetical protein